MADFCNVTLSASGPSLTLTATQPALTLTASTQSLTLDNACTALTLTVDQSSLVFDVISQSLNLTATGGDLELGLAKTITIDQTSIERFNIEPSGAKNGVNTIFTLPENVVFSTFRLYRNGVRLREDSGGTCDFKLVESGGSGTGYDSLETTDGYPLLSWELLTADYTKN